MMSTSQLRKEWAPPCDMALVTLGLHGEGRVSVRTEIVDMVDALNQWLIEYGYLTRKEDTGAYNCRMITGGDDYSLHAYGIALDLNWQTNPYGNYHPPRTDMPAGMTDGIQAVRSNSGAQVWRWGGTYSGNTDAMHFEIVCSRADVASGVNFNTLPGDRSDTSKDGFLMALSDDQQNTVFAGSLASLQVQQEVVGTTDADGKTRQDRMVQIANDTLAGVQALQRAVDDLSRRVASLEKGPG
jgi:hypothetical protein